MLTRSVCRSHHKKTEKPISFESKEVGFSAAEFSYMSRCSETS